MGLSNLSGTPWHVDKFARKEGDTRRHRSRCIYHDKADNYCSKVVGSCCGAAHCSYYKEHEADMTLAEISIKKQGEGFVMKVVPFKGIQMIPLNMITVPDKYEVPGEEKINAIINRYRETGKIDKPVQVSCGTNSYILEDKYLRYYVASFLNLKEVPAIMHVNDTMKATNKLTMRGARVEHSQFGKGTVEDFDDKKICVVFDSGKKSNLSLEYCVKNKLLRILS